MIIQLGVRHQHLPIERFRFLPVNLRILALVWEDGPFRPRESDNPKLIYVILRINLNLLDLDETLELVPGDLE